MIIGSLGVVAIAEGEFLVPALVQNTLPPPVTLNVFFKVKHK